MYCSLVPEQMSQNILLFFDLAHLLYQQALHHKFIHIRLAVRNTQGSFRLTKTKTPTQLKVVLGYFTIQTSTTGTLLPYPHHLEALGNPCRSPAENTRSPKANLMVSSALFQADAPREVAVKARFSSSEPIPTAQNGLSRQTNPTPENPTKSRFCSPKPLLAAQNGFSRQRNPASTLMCEIGVIVASFGHKMSNSARRALSCSCDFCPFTELQCPHSS